MRRCLLLIAGVLAHPAAPRAQCCWGAQHLCSTSTDGRYRVEAESLTGTGMPGPHGPYHYRFRLLERVDDDHWSQLGSFERKYDTRTHFTMQLLVSPAGNGFLLQGPGEDRLRFCAADGRVLSTLGDDSCAVSLAGHRWSRRKQVAGGLEGRIVTTSCPVENGTVSLRCRDKSSGASSTSRLFVALALPLDSTALDDEQDARTAWLLRMVSLTSERFEQQAAKARRHVHELAQPAADPAIDELVALGVPALPAIAAALTGDGGRDGLRRARDRILAWSCGLGELHNDLFLLADLLATDDPSLAGVARARLRAILPEDAPLEPSWVRDYATSRSPSGVSGAGSRRAVDQPGPAKTRGGR